MRGCIQQGGGKLVGCSQKTGPWRKRLERLTATHWPLTLLAIAVYLLTMDRSASWWDCGEFISTSWPNDGFRIAEADLKLRGPGDLEGTQQSGMAFDLKIADIARDGQLVQMARDEAQKIIDDDPECKSDKYFLLWNRLRQLRKTNINWAAIS